jgi:glycosyltransferase involved in cell wall biosynthesis
MAAAAVVPSLYEPFGITALEAMAAGTPLIAADTGGLAQIVRDGVNGWRFYAGNPNSLADAVLHVLHCPEAAGQIAEVARREVLSTYDWSAIARKTRDVYEEVLKETAAPEEAIAR